MRFKADTGESDIAAAKQLQLNRRCGLTRPSDDLRYYWRPSRRPAPTQAGFFDDRIVRLRGKFPIHGRLAP
jgi:hypothetical protein